MPAAAARTSGPLVLVTTRIGAPSTTRSAQVAHVLELPSPNMSTRPPRRETGTDRVWELRPSPAGHDWG
jgi:hypothetical protein